MIFILFTRNYWLIHDGRNPDRNPESEQAVFQGRMSIEGLGREKRQSHPYLEEEDISAARFRNFSAS
jgi:hypothetical protein